MVMTIDYCVEKGDNHSVDLVFWVGFAFDNVFNSLSFDPLKYKTMRFLVTKLVDNFDNVRVI